MTISLEEQFKKFKSIKFPSPPQSDELADWIFDYVLELDGYFAGIFSKIGNHKYVDISTLEKLEQDIEVAIKMAPKVYNIPAADKEIYHHFLGYLHLMLEIVRNNR